MSSDFLSEADGFLEYSQPEWDKRKVGSHLSYNQRLKSILPVLTGHSNTLKYCMATQIFETLGNIEKYSWVFGCLFELAFSGTFKKLYILVFV